MTSPVPDALRTQLAEVLNQEGACCGDCGRTPGDPLADCGLCERYLFGYADAILRLPLLARARAEGAAEALREAAESVTELAEELADAEDEAENAEVSWALGVARLRAEVKAEFMQDRAAALSAPTTTEGDPT